MEHGLFLTGFSRNMHSFSVPTLCYAERDEREHTESINQSKNVVESTSTSKSKSVLITHLPEQPVKHSMLKS